MDNLEYRKKMRHFIVTASFMLIAIVIALILASRSSQPAVAQMVDWCSQPGIIWCTSHEEFNANENLRSTNDIAPTPNTSWYARPSSSISGGGVDRNDDQYTSHPTLEPIRNNLPAKVVAVSTNMPARSGEITGKKYLELNADTAYADANLNPTYQYPYNTNAGIFLSRKVRGLEVFLTMPNGTPTPPPAGTPTPTANQATLGRGLYFSAWYRFPQIYESKRTGENDNLMVMEFMTERLGGDWRVPWSIHLKKKADENKMIFRVDERSATFGTNNSNSIIQHTTSLLEVPINKWVHLEVFYKYANYNGTTEPFSTGYRGKSNGGQVIVFQDGIEIYRFENVATTAKADDTGWVSDRWMVTAYAAADGAVATPPNPANPQTEPTNFQVLVDDAAISTTRLGVPRELISNGDFTTNTSGWNLHNSAFGTTSVDTGADLSANNPSAIKLQVTQLGPNIYNSSFHQTIAGRIASKTSYILRFTAKAGTTPTRTQPIRAILQHNFYSPTCCQGDGGNNYEEYWNSGELALSTTPKNFVFELTPIASTTTPPWGQPNPLPWEIKNSVLRFLAGDTSVLSNVTIDNVSLVQNGNLIPNGDFDGLPGSPSWTLVTEGATASPTTDTNAGLTIKNGNQLQAGKITINSAGSELYQPQYYQNIPTGTLNPGNYTLRFTAKSTIQRTIQLAIQEFDGDPTLLWWESSCGSISLPANEVKNFVCNFQISQPQSGTQLPDLPLVLNFLLGGVSGPHDVWIDNVSLVRSN